MEGDKGLVCGGLGQKCEPESPGEEQWGSDMRLSAGNEQGARRVLKERHV